MKKFNNLREDTLEEKLKSSDPTGKWIHDFVNSDNPKFAGKSKKERIRMALGASYGAKKVNEEIETTHEDPLVVTRDSDGKIHTHANLSVANAIHGTDIKHQAIHTGMPVQAGKFTFELSKHHASQVKEAKEKTEYDYEGDMARGQLQSVINNAQRVHDMLEDNDNLPEWVQSKITLAEDYISTVANYMMSEIDEEVEQIEEEDSLDPNRMDNRNRPVKRNIQARLGHDERGDARVRAGQPRSTHMRNKPQLPEEVEQLEEGRPSQRHPLEGHEYHKKSDEALVHIAKDAHAAAEAMKGHNTTAENKYRDQANDSATVRHFRKTSGMPDWYKKKYGHMNEQKVNAEVPFDGPYKTRPSTVTDKSGAKHGPMSIARNLAKQAMKKQAEKMSVKESLEESRKAEIVKEIMKKGKKKEDNSFQGEPELGSTVVKADT